MNIHAKDIIKIMNKERLPGVSKYTEREINTALSELKLNPETTKHSYPGMWGPIYGEYNPEQVKRIKKTVRQRRIHRNNARIRATRYLKERGLLDEPKN